MDPAMTTWQSMTLDSQQAVFVAIASFTVLCWDHVITFSDELDFIWCKRKGLFGFLFLLNRYITPLGFVVNIIALTLPTWSTERCRNFVRYEGAMATIGVSIAQLMMSSRIFVLYPKSKLAAAIPGLLFLVWVALEAFAMARGEMVPLAQQVHSCREVYDLPPTLSAARAWMPLTYDSAVFAMILWRTLPDIWNGEAGRILHALLQDGTLYYSVICSGNLVLTVMIVRAPPGQKGIAAQLMFLLTVVMTSRVTLILKKQIEKHRYYSSHSPTLSPTLSPTSPTLSPTLSKATCLFGPRQTSHPQLQSHCSTVVSSTPTPSVSIDADFTDHAQYLGDRLSSNRTCADVESQ